MKNEKQIKIEHAVRLDRLYRESDTAMTDEQELGCTFSVIGSGVASALLTIHVVFGDPTWKALALTSVVNLLTAYLGWRILSQSRRRMRSSGIRSTEEAIWRVLQMECGPSENEMTAYVTAHDKAMALARTWLTAREFRSVFGGKK